MSVDSLRLERLTSVVARTGMSRSWLYKQVAAGRFPPPCKVGGASRWSAAAVDDWIYAQLDAARAPAGGRQ
ncbi:helix-turn-helix transcriptional regulator [Brevundimonas huaxiensis]|uniref:helix-turn-helix transcriptional regulator n=1 Tax=Brevundimonas TaxID=41275 RepID=UPI001628E644|nr:AlpA family phage regulatory protein [Brevundimonas huaxiensis]